MPRVAAPLFKPLVSTNVQGMDVGLSICQSIVETHRGRIWAEANRERAGLSGTVAEASLSRWLAHLRAA